MWNYLGRLVFVGLLTTMYLSVPNMKEVIDHVAAYLRMYALQT